MLVVAARLALCEDILSWAIDQYTAQLFMATDIAVLMDDATLPIMLEVIEL